MQRFIAELSNPIGKADFERAWQGNAAGNPNLKVDFAFAGRRVTINIDSDLSSQWKSEPFHRTFTTAVHRVDQRCNIRWI